MAMFLFIAMSVLAIAFVWMAWSHGYESGYRDGRRTNFRQASGQTFRPRHYTCKPYDYEREHES